MFLESEHLVKEAGPAERSGMCIPTSLKDPSIASLVPTLFAMTKTVMRIRCSMARGESANKVQELVSMLESSILNMALDVEYLRKRGC